MAVRLRTWGVLARVALVLVAGALPASASPVPARIALVIGNAAYRVAALDNPRNDARAVTASLRDLGFRVTLVEDADLAAMRSGVAQFVRDLRPGSMALVYFAGHALQHRGVNYLVPIDFALEDAAALPASSVKLDGVLAGLHERRVQVALPVLDACRDNPFGRAEEALGPGLAPMENAPGETLIAYATGAGALAADGSGVNSPFTAAFVTALEQPELGLYDVFRRVRAAVREATEGRQLPWVSGSIESEVVLRAKPAEPDPVEAASLIPGASLASVFWKTIEGSNDTRDFDRFLDVAGEGPLSDAARDRRRQLAEAGLPSTPLPDIVLDRAKAPPGGVLASRTECDVVASSPIDQARISTAVPHGLVNVRLALRACTEALAAESENPRLAYNLGRALYIAQRFAEARIFYERAVAKDYAAAASALAFLHREGLGVPRDERRAAELYRRSAASGNLSARNTMGGLYRAGLGVSASPGEALAWVQLAADGGWPHAYDQLGNFYREGVGTAPDDAAAFRAFVRGAELGSHNAMTKAARMLRDGAGTVKDPVAAVRWFEGAIDAGNSFAPRDLGQMVLRGQVMKRDPRRAKALFELAGERGYVESYTDIAAMYEKGNGVEASIAEAHYWALLSVTAGRSRDSAYGHKTGLAAVERTAKRLPAEARADVEARVADYMRVNGPTLPLGWDRN